jgi:hypothetical protein
MARCSAWHDAWPLPATTTSSVRSSVWLTRFPVILGVVGVLSDDASYVASPDVKAIADGMWGHQSMKAIADGMWGHLRAPMRTPRTARVLGRLRSSPRSTSVAACSDDEMLNSDVSPMQSPLDVAGAYYPVARTRFTRTLNGGGAARPGGRGGGPTVAMRAIDSPWCVNALDALDEVFFAAGTIAEATFAAAHVARTQAAVSYGAVATTAAVHAAAEASYAAAHDTWMRAASSSGAAAESRAATSQGAAADGGASIQ